jgi:hypothetical protein
MGDDNRCVVPSDGNGWDVKGPHAGRASSHHEAQQEATQRAREIIQRAGGGELIVQARTPASVNRTRSRLHAIRSRRQADCADDTGRPPTARS